MSEDQPDDTLIQMPILDRAFKANPFPFYDAVRERSQGIARVQLPSGLTCWLVVSHALVCRLLNDPLLSKDFTGRGDAAGAPGGQFKTDEPHSLFKHLLMRDPPEHSRLRAIIARDFSPRHLLRLQPRIMAIADTLMDELDAPAEIDLMRRFARRLPLRVICQLLGVSNADETKIEDFSERLLSADLSDSGQASVIAEEFHRYLIDLAQCKRRVPDDSLYYGLVAIHDAGELSERELTAMGFILLAAGHETTMHLIGNGLIALMNNRASWQALISEPRQTQGLVDEMLRYCSPLEVATARIATADFPVADVTVRRGDVVFIGLAAANRDPAIFAEPHRFHVGRKDADNQIAFGHGIHYCVGAARARMEAQIAFSGLAQRFPDIQIATPLQDLAWTPGLIMRGVQELPVRLRRSAG